MTNRYEDALNELKGYSYGLPDDLWETVISALKLAQEAEQLRKERDEFKELYDVMVERYTELAKKVAGE